MTASSSAKNPLLNSRAYRIFVDELPQQMQRADDCLKNDAKCSKSELLSLAADFHTIKGGAGFFGLHDIYRLAGELEVILQDNSPNTLEKAREAYLSFCEHARLIPQPIKS